MAKSTKALEKHSKAGKLHYRDEDIRWATHELAAEYRAQRLKCKTIIDIGCGIGFQSFAFAKNCKKVYAIEIDPEKIKLAAKNALILGWKNIEFISGDALSEKVISKLKGVEMVFCDPERSPEERQRNVATIKPSIPELLKKYRALTENIAIEFPPQITEIPFDCEREYLSIDGALNRLTLYFGDLKKCERSAIVLPGKERLCSDENATLKETELPGEYLYEADPAIVKADLLAELSEKTGTALYGKGKNVFFTADKKIKTPFFKNAFKVIEMCAQEEHEIIAALQKHQAGQVILRFSVDPKEYWRIRKKIEAKLTGDKTYALLYIGTEAVLVEKADL
ncbi:MAG TPA: methyltransferase domain-containing protein [Candidatus Nanoarchaeia archaeon]|nr:methyltransferase domain-containing protein [Candidatus Nanoarchaeia archaeon]